MHMLHTLNTPYINTPYLNTPAETYTPRWDAKGTPLTHPNTHRITHPRYTLSHILNPPLHDTPAETSTPRWRCERLGSCWNNRLTWRCGLVGTSRNWCDWGYWRHHHRHHHQDHHQQHHLRHHLAVANHLLLHRALPQYVACTPFPPPAVVVVAVM